MFRDYLDTLESDLEAVVEGGHPSWGESPILTLSAVMAYLYKSAKARAENKDSSVNDLLKELNRNKDRTRFFLVTYRLMQLDMRGDPDVCMASLQLSTQQLAKLILATKYGIHGFEQAVAAARDKCVFCDREAFKEEKATMFLPCSHQHRGHYTCIYNHVKIGEGELRARTALVVQRSFGSLSMRVITFCLFRGFYFGVSLP